MSLNIHVSHDKPGVCKLQLSGRLDTNTAPTLDSTQTELLDGEFSLLIYDMAGVEYISSAGLRVIFKGTKTITEKGGRAGVMNLQPQIRKVFDIVKAMPDVPIFENDAEMDEYLDAMQQQVLDGKS